MRNMLASISFDPYNTPKSFPSGGGGGGTPGPPGADGADGSQGPAGGIEDYGAGSAYLAYPDIEGTLYYAWPGVVFTEASGIITIDSSTAPALLHIFLHGFLIPGENQDESIQWMFRTYLQETVDDFSTIVGRSWATVTPTDDFVPITHVASFGMQPEETCRWTTRAIVDHEDAGYAKYPLITELHVVQMLIPQMYIPYPSWA
jgi:hypothetical protein